MPKPNKAAPLKRAGTATRVTPKPNGHSLIVRSAESLGRIIGALQRQLDEIAAKTGATIATKKPASSSPKGMAKANSGNAARRRAEKPRSAKGG